MKKHNFLEKNLKRNFGLKKTSVPKRKKVQNEENTTFEKDFCT